MNRLSLVAYLGLFIALIGIVSLIESSAIAFEDSFLGFPVDYSNIKIVSIVLIIVGGTDFN